MLPRQQNGRCHSVSFVMYNADEKFEDHYFNISGDMLDSVFYYLCGTIYDVIPLLICITQKREYLLNEKRYIAKRKTPFVLTLKTLSNKQQLFFTS